MNYSPLTDVDLLHRILSLGDETAMWYLLTERYVADLRFYTRRYFPEKGDEQEFAEEVFLHLRGEGDWARLRQYEGRSSFRTWLSAVMAHLLSDLRRKQTQHPTEQLTPHNEPHSEVGDGREMVVMMEALMRLENEDYKFVLVKQLEGYEADEIADLLGEKRRAEALRNPHVKNRKTLYPTVEYVYMLKSRAMRALKKKVETLRKNW